MRLSDQRYEDIKIAIANFLEDYNILKKLMNINYLHTLIRFYIMIQIRKD